MLSEQITASRAEMFGPVTVPERISSVDILRGVAVCGILVINIISYALPAATLFVPDVAGGFEGLDRLTWQFSYVVFFQKMMAIFSMLFGAGLILMAGRAEQAGKKFAGIYYRRLFWLAIVGLIHAYLIWYGDILFGYALCGLLLYPLRRLAVRWLILLSTVILMIGGGLSLGTGIMFEYLRANHQEVQTTMDSGGQPNTMQMEMSRSWQLTRDYFRPPLEKIEEEVAVRRGPYLEMTRYFVSQTIMMQTQSFLFYIFWRAMALMLLGMALMKAGVFSAQRTFRFYFVLMVIGYGIAMPLTGYAASLQAGHDFDIAYFFHTGGLIDFFTSVFVALGHVSLVMIIVKSGAMTWLTRRLAAMGRMALTNYLMQSILMGLLFYGIGLGLFGRINRFGLIWIVIGTWLLQLIISPLWQKYYRFGPVEWLWRTLTYFKRQPMRV